MICPHDARDCVSYQCRDLCRYFLLAPIACLHFVGFQHEWVKPDMRYQAAVRAFGHPDIVHRHWDARASAEIADGDVVVFAEGDEHQPTCPYGYDDSHADIIAYGGPNDR